MAAEWRAAQKISSLTSESELAVTAPASTFFPGDTINSAVTSRLEKRGMQIRFSSCPCASSLRCSTPLIATLSSMSSRSSDHRGVFTRKSHLAHPKGGGRRVSRQAGPLLHRTQDLGDHFGGIEFRWVDALDGRGHLGGFTCLHQEVGTLRHRRRSETLMLQELFPQSDIIRLVAILMEQRIHQTVISRKKLHQHSDVDGGGDGLITGIPPRERRREGRRRLVPQLMSGDIHPRPIRRSKRL